MSALSENVSLVITADTVGIALAGFGVALTISYSATWTERTRTYGDLSDVASDFASGTPEYIFAQALFGQEPHPNAMMIGRGENKPTQVYVIGVASVKNTTGYAVNIIAPGTSPANPLTYTSDANATNDEIVAGLVSALNGVASKNYTAAATGSSGTQVVTVTGNAAGNWFSIEVASVLLLSIKQTHVDPGIAADLDAISLEDSSWYALNTTANSKLCVLATAAWIEAAGQKLYLVDVNETDAITVAVGSSPTDTLYALFALAYNRTAGSYYPSPGAMFSARWLGRVLPDEPGSETWKFKTLSGIAATKLSPTHKVNLRARKANAYETIAGANKTWEGTVAGGSYGFIDVTRGLDWLDDNMRKRVFAAISGPEKLPYTNPGVAVVRNEMKGSLKDSADRGIITDDFVITVPQVENISSPNKAIRKLPDMKWSATLAGAIHAVDIVGLVSV